MMMSLLSSLEISLERSWYTLKSKKGKIHLLYMTVEQTPCLLFSLASRRVSIILACINMWVGHFGN